jgi:hypothetical protein
MRFSPKQTSEDGSFSCQSLRATVVQYRLRACGFQEARQAAIEAIAEVDDRRRTKKCSEVPFPSRVLDWRGQF